MKIETHPLEDHQVKLTVEVESDSMETAKQKAARHLAKRVKIPGFRPGKAPYPVIVRQIGEEAILEEAIEHLINDIYPKIIDESGIRPYGPGQLENIVSMEPPVLEFVIPLEAEVELGDYQSISKPYEAPVVSEDEIEKVLSDLQDRQALLEPVERAAQEGDMVYLRLNGERKNIEEGTDPVLVRERSMPVLVKVEGDEEEHEWPFPGFSRELIGLSAGDEKTIEYTFSDESPYESLRGVDAEFKVVVEDVKSRTLPELNDEFAASFGEYESLEAVRVDIRTSLEENAIAEYNQKYDEEVLEEAIELSTFKYPPQMLEREIESVLDNLRYRLEQQGLEIDMYLKTREMDMEALREEARPVAESRLKRSLFLYELADKEKIEVKEEDLQAETIRTLEGLSQSLPEKEARKLGSRDVFQNVVSGVMADLISRRSLERLRSISSGIPEEQSETVEDAPEAADTEGTPEVELQQAETASGEGALVEESPVEEVVVDNTGAPEAAEVETPAPEVEAEAPASSEPTIDTNTDQEVTGES